jgi:protein-S-isoprenylcysteine O-methyltransferase Ste14
MSISSQRPAYLIRLTSDGQPGTGQSNNETLLGTPVIAAARPRGSATAWARLTDHKGAPTIRRHDDGRPVEELTMAMAYRAFGYFGVFSIFGAVLFGFRHNSGAPWRNFLFAAALYVAWAGVHLAMTSDRFKRTVYGDRAGSLIERRIYILVTVTTWLAVLWYHPPLPGPAIDVPGPLRFAATVGFLMAFFAFLEGMTFASLDGLIATPGTEMAYSHGTETTLLTAGRYAKVRHPMYQAVIQAGLCSLIIHANLAQLLWVLMVGGTFIAFIPIEESRLLAKRGDEYTAYMLETPWRLVRRVW